METRQVDVWTLRAGAASSRPYIRPTVADWPGAACADRAACLPLPVPLCLCASVRRYCLVCCRPAVHAPSLAGLSHHQVTGQRRHVPTLGRGTCRRRPLQPPDSHAPCARAALCSQAGLEWPAHAYAARTARRCSCARGPDAAQNASPAARDWAGPLALCESASPP